jgi:hypothetical protein
VIIYDQNSKGRTHFIQFLSKLIKYYGITVIVKESKDVNLY